MAARLALLLGAALAVLATACGSGTPKAKDSSTADVYTAVLKRLAPPAGADGGKPVLYVAPFENQKAITLETQVGVIDNLAEMVAVRFVDELSEAVDSDTPGSPAKGTEVVLLGPVVTTGSTTEVEAQRYASEADQVRYRFRVTPTADGGWEAMQVNAVEVPPTTSA